MSSEGPAEPQRPEDPPGGTFKCHHCPLLEHFDYRGSNPPFSRETSYLEEAYIMKDPFNPPHKGQVLVIGADCHLCKKSVCLNCSIFYTKRFCKTCALDVNLPLQLQTKIRNINKSSH